MAKRFFCIKNEEWLVYFERKERKPTFFYGSIKPRESFMSSCFSLLSASAFFDSSLTFSKNYEICMSLLVTFVFLARDQSRQSRAGKGGAILPARVANQNTGSAYLITLSKLNDRNLEQIDSKKLSRCRPSPTGFTAFSFIPRSTIAGEVVDTINTECTIGTCVVDTLIDICEKSE